MHYSDILHGEKNGNQQINKTDLKQKLFHETYLAIKKSSIVCEMGVIACERARELEPSWSGTHRSNLRVQESHT